MRVEKLRGAADDTDLVPAGQYFAKLARKLEDANVRETSMRTKLKAEDQRLEASYRRASASRSNTFTSTGALM
ncbi:MAG: hypothetical protein H7124_14950 [Phycisphaerales bacterium]|nr:hypothetical protein [Hyphomonadaceae bacterium]